MKRAVYPCVHLFSFMAVMTPTAKGLIHAGNATGRVVMHWDQGHNDTIIPPMLILQRGCTGSSAVIRMAKSLLADLGVP
eukprot:CAMPEP_0170596898 /NCGR_PEP_ID=MMETSP0224-20130122/15389_1 /TAXON_ID=285029 /ORGANISM="Togula jolla, Strain CCCM 725" /LENGTH=78 /DNA_ID=CAMNT_0010921273 /DNA_START=85 /DNA_END=318 /DNA_ORIENTATION=-